MTEKEENYINVVDIGASTIYSDFETRLLINYFVTHDLPRFERQVFTFWSAVADVGGLTGFLFSLCNVFLAYVNF